MEVEEEGPAGIQVGQVVDVILGKVWSEKNLERLRRERSLDDGILP